MKKIIPALFSCVALSQAAIVQFDLSPPGSDAAVGLSPTNEVPPAANSTGSGGALALTFDTDTRILSFAIGYGSAAGFTDLTGPADRMHLHGPAPAGSNAPVLVDLAQFHFPFPNPAAGGVIFGELEFPTNAVADLMAGLNYVNIHTTNYPGGEIRGQLIRRIPPSLPPTIVCPTNRTIECDGKPTTLTVKVSDPDTNALTVIWTINGAAMQTNLVAASTATNKVQLTAVFPLGTNVIDVAVSDGTGNTVNCGSTLTVLDRKPPVITSATATPASLWPPNHKMVDVDLKAVITDACGPTKWKIISVTSNEPVNGLGDGDTAPDWEICGPHTVKLRAERSGKGYGRTYGVTIRAEDAAGNLSAPKVVYVSVPKSQSGK